VESAAPCIEAALLGAAVKPAVDPAYILTADIDLDDTIRGKYDLDVAGHYARPEVFTLTVDETPRPQGAGRSSTKIDFPITSSTKIDFPITHDGEP